MNAPLPRYTWDQAHILGLGTARGFQALGFHSSTIRHWAANGLINAVGKAPGGAHLYVIAEVAKVADRVRKTPGRKRAAS